MTEKLLIVNADDFGFTEGVNEGIVRVHTQGVVTSTSVMTSGEAGVELINWSDPRILLRTSPSL